ncbi:imidazole glycerol phosphate synthase subunit hisH [Hydrobacter penzbergensis]|jgi:glutamine amidotransferase|uniref:Imidazole glycerol phosphate synthase subunit HisH n=1 Tax=Hydrobacter penzbergensis TaxID=1235997 RepID=A0A8X8IFH4_9BACT|nr:imidazole glycerol phosphate synthase subunit HisH [Hydrobacter penzbergensis]MBN8720593.1 imidazole glycerol phosphate synthase subunit HisH [Sediminibacterium magnilacihabitans]PQV59512.1 imidazole glycerol phosphate synthase subunit HisH [Sediminibacterium magnilacihabitans]SDX54249.1 imidazole glycerol phosphate synthase subunit hisH [Hydrobacter penzbergensis]
MNLVVIKYNAGNIQSVRYALERIGAEALVTDDIEAIQSADKVIFPGVGEASSAMGYLKERKLDAVIRNLKQPVLGICLGMQLMCKYSEENNTDCLGIFDEEVKWFKGLGDATVKVPQIGWNNIYDLQTPLFTQVPQNSYCYFVHGYYAALGKHTIATTDYVQPYSSALHKDNFYGTQFHPEKSAAVGEQILKNFITLIH